MDTTHEETEDNHISEDHIIASDFVNTNANSPTSDLEESAGSSSSPSQIPINAGKILL
jgi:hypothetical protein